MFHEEVAGLCNNAIGLSLIFYLILSAVLYSLSLLFIASMYILIIYERLVQYGYVQNVRVM